jgi:outer membrane protein assembly factor BamB
MVQLMAGMFLGVGLPEGSARAQWPGWRGSHRDGHSSQALPSALPTHLIPEWKIPVGHGYAGPVVDGGILVYVDETGGREMAHALNARDGKELWRTAYAPAWSDEFEPGPRCTPLIDGDRVYVQSAQGELSCLAMKDGARIWGMSFAELGMTWNPERQSNVGAAVRRGHTGSPIVDGDRLVVQVGSTNNAAIVAADTRTGRILWRSLSEHTSYSSPVVGTLAGRRQCITATCEGLVGLDMTDGTPLWRVPFKTHANRNVLTPILTGDRVIFASHSTGMRCVEVIATNRATATDAPGLVAREAWFNKSLRINLPTPVLVGGHLYGVGAGKDFVCINATNGIVTWSEKGYGDVANVVTDGARLLVLCDSGEVRLLQASPMQHVELGRFQACGKTYSQAAWADGVLHVKDPGTLAGWRLSPAPGNAKP